MLKFLRGLCVFILSFILVSCINAVMMSYTMEQIIQKDLITSLFKQTALPSITSSIGMSEEESKAMEELMDDEKVNEVINGISSELMDVLGDPNAEFDQSTLDQFIDYFIENKEQLEEITGSEIDVSEIEKFKESDEYKEFGEELTKSLKESSVEMDSNSRAALQGYNVITSNSLRVELIIISVIVLALIALVQWSFYKWIGTLGKALFTCGLCVVVIALGINYLIKYLAETTKFVITVNTGNILFMGIMTIIVGLLLVVVCKIINNMLQIKKNKEVEMNEVS